ncbi:MAG TPA: cobalamin biosynthesis protein [Methylococcaceae bacterium]|nr:cobalamin biosynthesis protein [Methylococcaceae bacterium]HIA45472.1 cobalamin biosynthesis protein [Methylococcaceae bacterium]HIO37665.1 cobalamin biosynthesis protein [Rhodospirillales bacterium]
MITTLIAVLLDWFFGEPTKYHPLVGFGSLAKYSEKHCYGPPSETAETRRHRGILALLLLLLPLTALATSLCALPYLGVGFSLLILYFTLGHKSLYDHTLPIAIALRRNNPNEARRLTSRIVSRDPSTLNITVATTESIQENGNDSIFATIFWFTIAGAPGALFYRLANTMDAMWGYRNDHYRYFGWAAARLDDVLNYLPARLTALSYALLGNTTQALTCWQTQAPKWDSPNAGPVMAAGAGALNILIGGPARYHGKWHNRPTLGAGLPPNANDIDRSLKLVSHSVWLWLIVIIMFGVINGS